jgi:TPR repeat protein
MRRPHWYPNLNAQFYLGVVYEYGHGVKQDHVEAVRLYRKAAEQGNPSGQNNLGFDYSKFYWRSEERVVA